MRWTEMSRVRGGERPSPEEFDVPPDLLLADDIGKLRYLASRGSKKAAVHLRDYYTDGLFRDADEAYKYTCYAASAGDEDSIGMLRREGRQVSLFFPEDIMFIETRDINDECTQVASDPSTFDAAYADRAEEAAEAILSGRRMLDVLEHVLWIYAEAHDISEQEAADILRGYGRFRGMRREAIVWFLADYGEVIGTVRRIVEDAGGTNPPIDLPKRVGDRTVERLDRWIGSG